MKHLYRWALVAILALACATINSGCGLFKAVEADKPTELRLASGAVTSVEEKETDTQYGSGAKFKRWITLVHFKGQPTIRVVGRYKEVFGDLKGTFATFYGTRSVDWWCTISRITVSGRGTFAVQNEDSDSPVPLSEVTETKPRPTSPPAKK